MTLKLSSVSFEMYFKQVSIVSTLYWRGPKRNGDEKLDFSTKHSISEFYDIKCDTHRLKLFLTHNHINLLRKLTFIIKNLIFLR